MSRSFVLFAVLAVCAATASAFSFSDLLPKRGAAPASSSGAAPAADPSGESAYAPDGAYDPRAALNPDPGLPWGVVLTNVPCFDGRLRVVGTIPGGTAVEQVEARTAPTGAFVRCKVLWKGEWQDREMWFRAPDVAIFGGPCYAEADPATRDAVLDYCAAWGRYEAARAANVARAAVNPHQEEYERARAAHEAMRAEVEDVLARVRYSDTHDLPGGPRERAELLARANRLRVEQRDEAAAFAAVRDRWQAWEDAHPAAASVPAPTPEMRAAAAEMQRLRPAASALLQGL